MLSGTVIVIGPAFGRLIGPFMAQLGGFAPFSVIAAMLLYVLAGMVFDLIILRRIHPAYWWGAGAVTILQVLSGPIGFSPPVVAFAARLAGCCW